MFVSVRFWLILLFKVTWMESLCYVPFLSQLLSNFRGSLIRRIEASLKACAARFPLFLRRKLTRLLGRQSFDLLSKRGLILHLFVGLYISVFFVLSWNVIFAPKDCGITWVSDSYPASTSALGEIASLWEGGIGDDVLKAGSNVSDFFSKRT